MTLERHEAGDRFAACIGEYVGSILVHDRAKDQAICFESFRGAHE